MAATTKTEEYVSLKLLINTESNKVLFAEAGKDFVDILCSFLTLPLGTIARLTEKKSSIGPVKVGCLNSLYRGLADLDEGCLSTDTIKQMLLQACNSAEDFCSTLKLNIDDTPPTKYFACSNYNYFDYAHDLKKSTNKDKSTCGSTRSLSYPVFPTSHDLNRSTNKDKSTCRCGCSLSHPVFPKQFRQGFVNNVATFVITDDLIVIPNCIDNASFGLLKEFGIKNISSVKEMIMNVTKEKVLDLLKCSLLSKSTLTHWFLGKKPSLEVSRCFLCNVESRGNIQIKLKLVIRKSDGKVFCAQGEQDFANLLLSFLTFPLGGITRIFGQNCSVGSISRFYKSVADLNENTYFISKAAKNRIVDPCISPHLKLSKQILPILEPGAVEYYCHIDAKGICLHYSKAGEDKSNCGKLKRMNLSKGVTHEGYVKGPAMYVATDDLVIAPLSPISAIGLLNRFNTPLDDLKEKVVTIGVKEALNILKAALTSTSALTNGLAHLLTEAFLKKLN